MKPIPDKDPKPTPESNVEPVVETKSTLEIKSNSDDIRIYIDGLIHARFPRDKNMKLYSWSDVNTKLFNIDIWTAGHLMTLNYQNKELWTEVLKLLDKHI